MKLDVSRYTDEAWRGFVLHDGRRDLLERHAFVTWVAGISHFPDAADLPDFAPGNDILLQPEPDNPFDSNAMGVWNANGTVQVGHLPAVIVHDLSRWPGERHGLVIGEMVQGTDRQGLWVVVAREPVVLRVVPNLSEPAAASIEAWVRHAKEACRRSEERRTVQAADPLEQMRQMAASLKQSD